MSSSPTDAAQPPVDFSGVEGHPRVVEARARLTRGEITPPRFYQIRKEVAGFCRHCARKAVDGTGVCDEHRKAHANGVNAPPAPVRGAQVGHVKICRACGKPGHNRRTCARQAR